MFLTMIAVAVAANAPVIDTTTKLDLRVRVVEALAGGPVIIETTLTNRTGRELMVGKAEKHVGCSQISELPSEWRVEPRVLCGGLHTLREERFEPAQVWHHRHALHHDWVTPFPAGRHQLTVVWPLEQPPFHPESVGCPARRVEITIAPATPANLAALSKRVQSDLDAIPPREPPKSLNVVEFERFREALVVTNPELARVAERVLFTPHREHTPTILKILDRCTPGVDGDDTKHLRRDLIATVFAADPTAPRTFVDLLTAKTPPRYAASVLSHWGSDESRARDVFSLGLWRYELGIALEYHGVAGLPRCLFLTARDGLLALLFRYPPRLLPPVELARLQAAPDFWVRALTYASFSPRLDSGWCRAFLAEARGRFPAPPAKVVGPLVRDLDGADFVVREAAERKLIALGHGVAPALRAVVETNPSKEAVTRAEAALGKLAHDRLDPRAAAALAALDDQPGAKKLLAALASGPETDPVAVAARSHPRR